MSPFRFAAIGDNCVDRFQPPVSRALIGGNALNVGVQLALMGHEVRYFGAVGNDRDGERTRAALAANGVLTDRLRVTGAQTAYTDVVVTENGERIFAHEEFGACRDYVPDEADMAVLLTMDHVHIGWIRDAGLVRRRLAAAGVSVSQDISVQNEPVHLGVEGLSVAFGSAGDDLDRADAMLERLHGQGARLAVVTSGARGSAAFDGRTRARAGIRPVDVVDTTGAGDSFIAGFLAAWRAGASLQVALEAGRDRAALTCGHLGGFPQEAQPL